MGLGANLDLVTRPETKKHIFKWSWKCHPGIRPIFAITYVQAAICAIYCWSCLFKRDVTLNKSNGPMHWQSVDRSKMPFFLRPFYPKNMINPEIEHYIAISTPKN